MRSLASLRLGCLPSELQEDYQAMTIQLFIVGFISIFSQVAILRELSVAYYGVELIYVVAIGLWMLWSALGAAVGRRAGVPSPVRLGWLFIAFGLLLVADVAFIRGTRVLFGGIPGAYLPFERQMLGMALALLPMGVALGLAFQWAAKIYVSRHNRSLAMAYGIESLGAILGGIGATVLMALGISNLSILMLCAAVSTGAAVLPIDGVKQRWMSLAAAAVSVVLLAGLTMVNRLDRYMTSWNHPDIIESRDSPYSRVSLAGREGQLVVYENDVLSFETEGTTAEEFVHLSALNHPNPIRVLVSGGGVEGLIHEVRKHGAVSVDYVEINRELLEIVRRHLPEAFHAENARIVEADPRSFLKTAEPYDLILNGMPDPVSGSTNRFYTREYFRLCSEKLAPKGVFAFRLSSLENLWTQFLTYRNTSIYNALTAEFKDVVVLPGVTNTFIAANRPLTRDPTPLVERFRRKAINSRLVSGDYVQYVYTSDRFSEIVSLLTSTDAPENTDRRPICYQYSTLLWLSKLLPDIINQHPSQLQTSALWTAAAALLVAIPFLMFLSYRSRIGSGRVMAVFCAGLLGMMAETLLILHYQVKIGVLFQNIGILLTAFMAGLTLGAIIMAGWFPSPSRRTGKLIAAGFGLFSLLLVWILNGGHAGSLGAVSALLFVSGALVAALFAYVSLAVGTDQKLVVSPLYAADLLGGCIGAIIAGLILIPFFGMDQTAAIMILVSVVVFFLI